MAGQEALRTAGDSGEGEAGDGFAAAPPATAAPEGVVAREEVEPKTLFPPGPLASVELTPAEFAILQALMEASGRALSRVDLLGVLGVGDDGSERTVDSHVRNLRTKVEADPRVPAHVETVFGMGYRFAAGAL